MKAELREPECQCLTCMLVRDKRSELLRGPGSATRSQRKQLERDNKQWPVELRLWPENQWPPVSNRTRAPDELWRSRDFLVQIYKENDDVERLSVIRTKVEGDRFVDGISWEDLQRLKRECGRGDRDAVEIFPADKDIVNVANMRHLWVLPYPFDLAWRTKPKLLA